MDPFQQHFIVQLEAGEANGGSFELVPPAKMAVIEHVSVIATGLGAGSADYFITSTIEGNAAFREVPLVTGQGPTGAVIGSHPIRAFAGPESQFGAVIRRQDTSDPVIASVVLAGFYEPA